MRQLIFLCFSKLGAYIAGLKPFKFYNYWLENKDLKKMVEKRWKVIRWMRFILKEKLEGVKKRLRLKAITRKIF